MAKISFQYLNRRVHLYLGMFCLPWFIMYGISSLAFNHPSWFSNGNGQPGGQWKMVDSWPCSVEVPNDGSIPHEVAQELVRTAGLDTNTFGAYRTGEAKITVYFPSFRKMRQLIYRIDENRLVMNERKKFAQQFLTGMHARGGFHHDSLLNDSWAFIVDAVCVAFMLWVVTGIIMWLRVPEMRSMGAVFLVSGFLTFVGFMVLL